MINNVAYMIQVGLVKKPIYLQFVMGVLGGISPSSENLLFLVDYAKKLIGMISSFPSAWQARHSSTYAPNPC